MKKNISSVYFSVCLLVVLSCAAVTHAQTILPALDVPDQKLNAQFDWPNWRLRVFPIFDKIVGFPAGVATIHIIFNPVATATRWANNAVDTVVVPQSIYDFKAAPNAADYGVPRVIVAEMGHLAHGPLAGTLSALGEALSSAASDETYEELLKEGYLVAPQSGVSSCRMFANLPRNAMAGGSDYYQQGNDMSGAGWLELMTGGNLKALNQALWTLAWQRFNNPRGLDLNAAQPFLDMMDQVLPPFEGKLPSTVYRSWVDTFFNGPDGAAFAAYPQSDIKDANGQVVYYDYAPIIRKDYFMVWVARSRANGQTTVQYNPGTVYTQVLDGNDRLVMEDVSNPVSGFPATPPNGAYKTKNYWCPTGATCNPSLATQTHTLPMFAVDDPTWYNDHLVVIANGDGQGGGFEQIGKVNLHVVNPDPRVELTVYPDGLYYFALHGFRGSIPVTDDAGKTYSYMANRDQTQVAYWTDLDQPYLYAVTDASNWKPVMTPGSWTAAWTYFAIHNDPQSAPSIPLPSKLAGATVRITDANGKTYDAALNYASQTQINFQAPWELPLGKAKVTTLLNDTASNEVEVDVVTANPSIFPIGTAQDGNTEGAITAIFGPQAGKIVGTQQNQVGKTDWVSIWANGLGPVQPPQQDGVAPLSAAQTTNPVSVTLGGISCAPNFAGLAPGMVSLGQLNVNLATCQGLTAGSWPLTIAVAGVSSDPMEVTVQ